LQSSSPSALNKRLEVGGFVEADDQITLWDINPFFEYARRYKKINFARPKLCKRFGLAIMVGKVKEVSFSHRTLRRADRDPEGKPVAGIPMLENKAT
jgi:hypothetical protein